MPDIKYEKRTKKVLEMDDDRINLFRAEISRLIKGPQVLQYLIPAFISQEAGNDLKTLYRCSPERANHKLLDVLICSHEPGKWTAFTQALDDSDYTYLSRIVQSSDTPKSYNSHSRIIELFAPYIEEEINPLELIDLLVARKVLNDADKEEITARHTNDGAIAACRALLDRMQTHLDPEDWYNEFMLILQENNQGDIVQRIDPYFQETSEINKESLFINEMSETVEERPKPVAQDDLINRIVEHRPEIVEIVRVREVAVYLVPAVISQTQLSSLLNLDTTEPTKAMSNLIDHVINTKNPTAFIKALHQSEYPYLATLLENPDYDTNCRYLRKMIQIFSKSIQKQVNPVDIISRLRAEHILNDLDQQTIMATLQLHGKLAATIEMLDRIQCRVSPREWYSRLLKILQETGNSHVVQLIEPDFLKNSNHFCRKLEQIELIDNVNKTDPLVSMIDLDDLSYKENILIQSYIASQQEITRVEAKMLKDVADMNGELERRFQETSQFYKRYRDNISQNSRDGSVCANILSNEDNIMATTHFHKYPKGYSMQLEFISSPYVDLQPIGYMEENKQINLHHVPRITTMNSDSQRKSDEIRDERFDDMGLLLNERTNTLVKISRVREYISNSAVSEVDSESNQSSGFEKVKGERDYEEPQLLQFRRNIRCQFLERENISSILVPQAGKIIAYSKRSKLFYFIDEEDDDWKLIVSMPGHSPFDKLAVIDGNRIACLSLQQNNIQLISLANGSSYTTLGYNCEHQIYCMDAAKTVLYVLCHGKHLHAYTIPNDLTEGNIVLGELELGGIAEISDWQPKAVSLTDDAAALFVLEGPASVFCFKPNGEVLWRFDGRTLRHETLFCSIGIVDNTESVLLLDANNKYIVELDMQGSHTNTITESVPEKCDVFVTDNIHDRVLCTSGDTICVFRYDNVDDFS